MTLFTARFTVVQSGFTGHFKQRNQVLHVRNGQLRVVESSNRGRCRIQTPVRRHRAAAVKRGVADDGLQRDMIAEAQVVKNFGNEFGVLADGGVNGNADFDRRAEGGVDDVVLRDELIERITRA